MRQYAGQLRDQRRPLRTRSRVPTPALSHPQVRARQPLDGPDRVRAELKRPGDEPSVTLAANRWGFHHLSQFASLYTRKFGELPSETLRAAKSSRQVPVTRQSDSDPLGC